MSLLPYNNSNSFEAKVYPDEYIDTFTWNRVGQRLLQNDLSLSGTVSTLNADFAYLETTPQLVDRAEYIETQAKVQSIENASPYYDSAFSTVAAISANITSSAFNIDYAHGVLGYKTGNRQYYASEQQTDILLDLSNKVFDISNELCISGSTAGQYVYTGTDTSLFLVIAFINGSGTTGGAVTSHYLTAYKNNKAHVLLAEKEMVLYRSTSLGGSAIVQLATNDILDVRYKFDGLNTAYFNLDFTPTSYGLSNYVAIFKIGRPIL